MGGWAHLDALGGAGGEERQNEREGGDEHLREGIDDRELSIVPQRVSGRSRCDAGRMRSSGGPTDSGGGAQMACGRATQTWRECATPGKSSKTIPNRWEESNENGTKM